MGVLAVQQVGFEKVRMFRRTVYHVALFNRDCDIMDRLLVHHTAVEDPMRLRIHGKRALKSCGDRSIEQEKPSKRVCPPPRAHTADASPGLCR